LTFDLAPLQIEFLLVLLAQSHFTDDSTRGQVVGILVTEFIDFAGR
jgi:hypothetical protein